MGRVQCCRTMLTKSGTGRGSGGTGRRRSFSTICFTMQDLLLRSNVTRKNFLCAYGLIGALRTRGFILRKCLYAYRQIQLELKVIQQTEVNSYTFVSQSFKVIRRNNDKIYDLKDIFVSQNLTAKRQGQINIRIRLRLGRIGHQPYKK